MVDKNLDAFIEDVVHGALEDYVEKMSSRLTQYLLSGVDNPDMLSTLAARAKSDAMAIFTKYKGRISKETREAFLEAVESYEVEVEQALEKLHTKRQLTKQGALEFAQAARGIGEIVSRQNIALANTMATTWYTIAANAIVRRELGDSRRAIMEDAVRALSDAGIETVDYKSGVKTTIDAAVRRHIVSQVSQAKAQILSDKCDEYDQDLVFVSAHFGARPSHAMWQGKVYSRSGTSDKYPSLDEGTGYSGTGPFAALGDRLCGVNCQHEMVPYMPGLSQLPDLSFEKEQKRYGMTSEEYYKATQKQRALERKVRKYKRRIALGQEQGLDMAPDRYKLGRTQALLREHCRANGLTRLYERERAYGVKKQPRGLGRIDFKNTRAIEREELERSIKKKRNAASEEQIKRATVNLNKLNSKKYAQQFKRIAENKKTKHELLKQAKRLLTKNSGTLKEGMAFIDSRTGEVFWSVASGKDDQQVSAPVSAVREIRRRNREAGRKVVIAIHTHPLSTPPSPDDFESCARKGYKKGYVVAVDGSVYEYTAEGRHITRRLISEAILDSIYIHADTKTAILEAIKGLSKDYDISCREL
ncbi:phage capsid protein [Atopobium sp. BV3Ac4]|uniref:phage capsid protein n=1 Tax=Atopobium sp. BV3Ac4 TaxID=1111121 RepID=UPI0003ADCFD0|nr:phage capsid protein [Atopobium sp. BV3Ac4]ERL15476.1 phage minor capsid protein 2 [Atopobium sp. BV3Ac4]